MARTVRPGACFGPLVLECGTQLDPTVVKAFFRSRGWEPLEDPAALAPMAIEQNRVAI
jgi:hypothetical protein